MVPVAAADTKFALDIRRREQLSCFDTAAQPGRAALERIDEQIREALVLVHPFVVGELACGNLKSRSGILADLQQLPSAVLATDGEVMQLIEERRLWGLGIGWIDGHLLASALFSNCRLWTLDRRLNRAAAAAGVRHY